jgi:hypothetical protein
VEKVFEKIQDGGLNKKKIFKKTPSWIFFTFFQGKCKKI